MKDLLLEIGVEEIPARFMPEALRALSAAAASALDEAGLVHKRVDVYGTPRRLAFVVHDLAEKSPDRVQEAFGPGLAQAKDAGGNWTPAAQGFARSQNVPLEQLEVRDTDRGPRLCAVRKIPGTLAEKILPALLPAVIGKISFPKSMVWESSRTAFARPLRWLAALYGTKPVKFTYAAVKSGNRTQGLRFQGRGPIPIPSPAKYVSALKDRCVIVDPMERRDLIGKQIAQAVKPVHGHVPLEKYGDLLNEVVHLVEHPVAVLGHFDERHLELPAEVLVTSMKKHQKYFPVFQDKTKKLLPHFVGIRNGFSENQAVVREGYERVLSARLSDAAFFFQNDRKAPLDRRVESLKGVAFLSPRLSMFDKAERVKTLARSLARQLALPTDALAGIDRIARLGKADLVTGMVGEFPELQGVMGRIYARLDGESEAVAQGIEEHYWPLTAEGELPSTDAAALVSVADKLDTLAGNFTLGKVPSGSQDPYGLRRASIGVLRILSERKWGLLLPNIVAEAISQLPADLGDKDKAQKSLEDFFRQRWSALMEAKGFRSDEVAAVVSAKFEDVPDAEKRLSSLQAIRRHADFEPLSVAFKRAANILSQAKKKGMEFSGASMNFPTEPAEKDIFVRITDVINPAAVKLAASDYDGTLVHLVQLRQPIDEFFLKFVVMDPDKNTAANRLSLLDRVVGEFRKFAHFDRLQDTPSAAK